MRNFHLEIRLDRQILVACLLGCIVALCASYVSLNYLHHHQADVHWLILQWFDLDEENNLPTWFSSLQLLLAGLICLQLSQSDQDSIYWYTLAIGMFALSMDEVAGLHETINTAIEMNWAIPGFALVIAAGTCFIPFLLRLPRPTSYAFCTAGALFVSGAVGVEYLSRDMDEASFYYILAVTLEEALEMIGVWLFVRTLTQRTIPIPGMRSA